MTVGLSTTNTANVWLNQLDTLATHGKLHIGDPLGAGTGSPSTEVTRKAITWGAAASGVKSMSGTLSWPAWSAGNENLSHLSAWSNVTAGNFAFSVVFATPRAVVNGDTLTVTSLSVSQGPLAA